MPEYLHPGVYLEEIPSGVKPIEGVSTSIAAFIGPTVSGPDEPVRIRTWEEYERTFGGFADYWALYSGSGEGPKKVAERNRKNDLRGLGMTLAAWNYFLNGGSDAFFVRVLVSDSYAQALVKNEKRSASEPGVAVLRLQAKNPGVAGNSIRYKIEHRGTRSFKLSIGHRENGAFKDDEIFDNVNMDPLEERYVVNLVNMESNLVTLSLPSDDNWKSFLQPAELQGSAINASDIAGWLIAMPKSLGGDKRFTLTVIIDGVRHELDVSVDEKVYSPPNNSGDDKLLKDLAEAIQSAGQAEFPGFSCLVPQRADSAKCFVLKWTPGTLDPKTSISVAQTAVADRLGLSPKLHQATRRGSDLLRPAEVINNPLPLSGVQDDLVDGQPWTTKYGSVLEGLKKVGDISIIVLPGRALGSPKKTDVSDPSMDIIDLAEKHCEASRNRMYIVDPPDDELKSNTLSSLGQPTSTYTALYYPWLRVTNPFYNAEKYPGIDPLMPAEPSAVAAALWARTDSRRGVWKAPAGVEATLQGVAALAYQVEDSDQNVLNPAGINCLRKLPGFGAVIWGARTLATKSNPEWRYIPVRRTAILIEQSIYNGIQWAVFEPNDHRLWSSLRVNIGSFMDGLYRAGAFQGEKASDAYFVRCGLGDTMTQGDIDAGRVIAVVGFAPLKPAEFVIVRIQQKVQQ